MSSEAVATKQDCTLTNIDDLPTNIVQSILDLMPLKDAIMTSALSKQWQNRWKFLSRVLFDKRFCDAVEKEDDSSEEEDDSSEEEDDSNEEEDDANEEEGDFNEEEDRDSNEEEDRGSNEEEECDYVGIVNTVLGSQKDPIIELYFFIPFWLEEDDLDCVNQWIQFVARSGVKKLTLVNDYRSSRTLEVPECLFSCIELTHLYLKLFTFSSPLPIKDFPHLVCLRLDLNDPELDKLDVFISAFPELRMLHLNLNMREVLPAFPRYLCVSAPKVERLVFIGSAPYGLHLRLRGAAPKMRKIFLRLYPSFYRIFHNGMKSSDTVELFASLCNIEELDLSFHYWKVLSQAGDIPNKLPSLLPRLRDLDLSIGSTREIACDWNQFLFALCLLRSSPNLQRLNIFVNTKPCKSELPCHYVLSFVEGCSLKHLRSVNVQCVSGATVELRLITFILEYSPALQVMSVEFRRKVKEPKMDESVKELTKFPRASPKAELIFTTTNRIMYDGV